MGGVKVKLVGRSDGKGGKHASWYLFTGFHDRNSYIRSDGTTRYQNATGVAAVSLEK